MGNIFRTYFVDLFCEKDSYSITFRPCRDDGRRIEIGISESIIFSQTENHYAVFKDDVVRDKIALVPRKRMRTLLPSRLIPTVQIIPPLRREIVARTNTSRAGSVRCVTHPVIV